MGSDGASEAEELLIGRIVRKVVERLEDKGYTDSLRDRLAMAALSASYDKDADISFYEEALRAYEIADAMLAAKAKEEQGDG